MLRRLEKRILVPLPGMEAREAMFRHHLPELITDLQDVGHAINTHLDYERLAQVGRGEGRQGGRDHVGCQGRQGKERQRQEDILCKLAFFSSLPFVFLEATSSI